MLVQLDEQGRAVAVDNLPRLRRTDLLRPAAAGCGRLAAMTSTAEQRELTVGMGAGGLATADMVLNIGPQHPATHGVLRLRIVLDGERIVAAEPIIGYMHRGAEKLFEVRDYRQIIVLANRHDWLSAFSNELGVVLGVERMLGMEVPERAVWARTLLAELNRVLNHLMFLGSYPLELGAITPIFYAFREREELQAVMEEVSGGRMHYMFNRVGGLKEDLPAGWLGRVARAVAAVRRRLPDLETLIVGNEILRGPHPRGRRARRPAIDHAYGVSGPIARASGVDLDLRRDEPYLAYGELFAGRPGPGRDPHRGRLPGPAARCCSSRCTSASTSPRPASTGCGSLPQGPVNVRLPKVLKVPEGDLYTATENPLGINGYYLVSRGEKTPWRLKLRSASFNNIAVLAEVLPGNLDRRHGGDPRLDVLRRRRHRQVALSAGQRPRGRRPPRGPGPATVGPRRRCRCGTSAGWPGRRPRAGPRRGTARGAPEQGAVGPAGRGRAARASTCAA